MKNKMKKLILLLLLAECCLMTANAQKTVVSQINQKVFDTVEQMPEYPGGMQAMIEFLQTNMKYPEDAAKQKVEERVMVQFVVETDDSLLRHESKVARLLSPLSSKEQQVCLLTIHNFLPYEIANLTISTPQVITNTRVRLLKKLFGEMGGAKDFDTSIKDYCADDVIF